MTDPTLLEIIARLERIKSQQREILQLLRHGVTPPEWANGEVLAMSLGIKPRAVDGELRARILASRVGVVRFTRQYRRSRRVLGNIYLCRRFTPS
ncbi:MULTISPECIES: hypothetical protein [Cyanophyceae]|uniref:hypothetical protein n=1 Tax=Cyanophyceae TaxID=3028117 RepID=UPI001687B8AB|nr:MULTISPECIES: hypothetical protein [Cyanophyceae]MBD1914320.1 hypothetical protein [Phormidium sp. FACHB-77]MBD2028460.1 hypothetical protein [Phormidium sp. FACHB-322]MBD2053610.1 hypothetical protein [Leptolyngbya sp. FACHB-60]